MIHDNVMIFRYRDQVVYASNNLLNDIPFPVTPYNIVGLLHSVQHLFMWQINHEMNSLEIR